MPDNYTSGKLKDKLLEMLIPGLCYLCNKTRLATIVQPSGQISDAHK